MFSQFRRNETMRDFATNLVIMFKLNEARLSETAPSHE